MPITQFTKTVFHGLRADLDVALKAVAEKHGISLRTGNIKFDSSTAKIMVEAAVKAADGRAVSPHAAPFRQLAEIYGLKASDLGRQFKYDGRGYIITGCRPRASRMPITVTEVVTGKNYHMSASLVKMALTTAA
jgi:hypothetical protein